MVVDKSGSMFGLASDVRGGYNSFLDKLGLDEGIDYRITTVLFDTKYQVLCVDATVDSAPRLDEDNYAPSGMTALHDAVGRAIAEFEGKNPSLGEDDKVMLVIQTDGEENSSKELRADVIKEIITARTKTGKWSVIYIGAGLDTWHQAQSMGVTRNQYVNTSGSRAATRSSYVAMAQSFGGFARGEPETDWMEDLRKGIQD
jgi:hypothetical protein